MPPTTHQGDANPVQLDSGLPNTAQHAGRPHRSTDCYRTAHLASLRDARGLGAGGIYRVKRHTSKSQYWIRPGAFGSRSIFGVLADENSNTLWACSNDLSAIGVLVAGSDSKSTLKGFDLKTGAGKVSAVLPNEHSLCNDIAVGQDGSVFVTNSAAPEILRLPPGSQRLEV